MGFDFRCPAMGCEYEARNWEQLRGHINGMRPQDSHHDQLEPQKKWMFRSAERRL